MYPGLFAKVRNEGALIQGGCLFDILAKGVEAYMGEGTYYYITLLLIDTYSRKYGTGKKSILGTFYPWRSNIVKGCSNP